MKRGFDIELIKMDVHTMEDAIKTARSSVGAFGRRGLDISKMIDPMGECLAAAQQDLASDPWEEARALVDDILDGGVPTRSSAIALAKEAKKMLDALSGTEGDDDDLA
jgi:hypothetical protein